MNTLDDLRGALDAYADRGELRGAADVLTGARTDVADSPGEAPERRGQAGGHGRTRRTARTAAAALLVIVLAGAIVVAGLEPDDVDVVTTPDPDPSSLGLPVLPTIVVPDGAIQALAVGTDRVWIATNDRSVPGRARLRSFDIETGAPASDLELDGLVADLALTDDAVFVRLERVPGLVTHPGEPARTDAVVHVDPEANRIEATLALDSPGPIAASGSVVVFADMTDLHTYDDATGTATQIPIRDAVGHDNTAMSDPTTGATFGFVELAVGRDGLFGKYANGNELVQMDPADGAHVATQLLEDGAWPLGRPLAAAPGYLWSTGGSTVYGISTPIRTPPDLPAERRIEVSGAVSDLGALDDGRFVAVLDDHAVVGGDPERAVVRTELDPIAIGQVVHHDGQPWVAQWSDVDDDPSTTVTFVRVRTDEATAGTDEPETPDTTGPTDTTAGTTTTLRPNRAVPSGWPPPVLRIGSEQLVDGTTYPMALIGVYPFAEAHLTVCRLAAGEPDRCGDPFDLDPANGLIEDGGMGEILAEWTARRSVFDDRWYDCAVEACVLRAYDVDPAGGVDESSVVAETPLTFNGDTPPLRPSLVVSPAGPIRVGSTVTITGSGFPPNGSRISVGICATGRNHTTCRYDVSTIYQTADASGRVNIDLTIRIGAIEMPALGPDGQEIVGEVIDCTAAPGACSLSVFPGEGSQEPYATVPVDITG
jgi:hypothetical protein